MDNRTRQGPRPGLNREITQLSLLCFVVGGISKRGRKKEKEENWVGATETSGHTYTHLLVFQSPENWPLMSVTNTVLEIVGSGGGTRVYVHLKANSRCEKRQTRER